jgi:hypothetical protein
MGHQSTQSAPEYLALSRFAGLAGTNRWILTQKVKRGEIQPSAWCDNRPIFAVRDLPRIREQLNGN